MRRQWRHRLRGLPVRPLTGWLASDNWRCLIVCRKAERDGEAESRATRALQQQFGTHQLHERLADREA